MRTIFLLVISSMVLLMIASLVSGCGQLLADKVVAVGDRDLTVAKGPTETPKTHEVAPDAEVTLDGKPAQLEDIQPGDAVEVTTEKEGGQELAVKVEATRSEQASAADKKSSSNERTPPPIGLPEQPAVEEPAGPPEGEMEPPAAKNEPADEADAEASGSGDAKPAPNSEDQAELPEREDDAVILFTGMISSVDEDQIRVQGHAEVTNLPEERTFMLNDETEITLAGERASKEDLAKGAEVTVTAERQGAQLLVKRIDAKPVPA